MISEFSYGYALTEELASGAWGPLDGAPIFPSLIEEGRPGGGYDLRLPLVGAPLYLQFKLSDCLMHSRAGEWGLFKSPYYRMHIRPRSLSRQHGDLVRREQVGDAVFYVAPCFHKSSELNQHYAARTVADNSAWFSPVDIGLLPDDDDHYVVFNQNVDTAYFCSQDPKPLAESKDKEAITKKLIAYVKERQRKVDDSFFQKIVNDILSGTEFDQDQALLALKESVKSPQRGVPRKGAILASFLARSILNAELFIVSRREDRLPA